MFIQGSEEIPCSVAGRSNDVRAEGERRRCQSADQAVEEPGMLL